MARSTSGAFRVGKVQGYCRGKTWYLCYFEQGQRKRPRVGPDREAAKVLAAQTHARLEIGAPSGLSFEPITIPELRERWLEYHEHVSRSSVGSIRRYRAATDHLLNFIKTQAAVRLASFFTPQHAESFVVYLRQLEVAPNGHAHSRRRHLLDKGVKYILQVCRSLFTYAKTRRHLSPYAENPFSVIGIDKIPVEDAKVINVMDADQEVAFLSVCDDWEFPIFFTLMMTGMRPGELTHLLMPENVDLANGWLLIRNKAALGWQVKTRNERDIPLLPEVVDILRIMMGQRNTGPLFVRKHYGRDELSPLAGLPSETLRAELVKHEATFAAQQPDQKITRSQRLKLAAGIWRDAGAADVDRIRSAYIRRMEQIGHSENTAPKLLRHNFATCMQDAKVDPLIRNQLMGHRPAQDAKPGGGLGMTAVYTHSRPGTVREQFAEAMQKRSIVVLAREWIKTHQSAAVPAVPSAVCADSPAIQAKTPAQSSTGS